jgi:calcineurin-like phosphoesterase family protein
MKVWLISDTHANHDKIKTYCDRPDNFTDLIVKNCQRIVQPDDILIHLGDVAIGPPEGAVKFVRSLPGVKWLIRGNHDSESPTWWVKAGFSAACDGMLFRKVWLSHHPAPVLPEGAVLNVHGHLHNVWDGFKPPNMGEFAPAPWRRLFAVEYTNYSPVEFDKFVNKPDKYKARGKVV